MKRLMVMAGASALLVASVLVAVLLAHVAPAAEPPTASRAALEASFEADIRNLVYTWDPDDLRPPEDRARALREFIYETFESSAWIPQSLFEGNLVTQAVVGDVDTIVREKVGLVLWPENPLIKAYGMAPGFAPPSTPHVPLKWTVNCVLCHTAEIDGRAYFGAGTKVFDEKVLGDALKLLTNPRGRLMVERSPLDDRLASLAHDILTRHHHDKIDSLTRARSTAFAASHVELYMRPHSGAMPAEAEVGRGDVKVPPLWHTAAKMPAGRWYVDGSFHGPFPLMASSMELEKDRSFETLTALVLPKIKEEFRTVVQHLRPPRYPYAIDGALAAQGKALFYSADVGCSRCHGVYDGKGGVTWPGRHMDVGTDRSRLDVVSPGFIEAFESSPIAAEGRLIKSEGYAATPLTGVWANYPYLHNGSVPTLHHLLGPAGERPRIFEVKAARHFDQDRVGQRLSLDPSTAQLSDAARLRRFEDDRDWFNTARDGCGNAGHDVWGQIRTDARRRAIIEYLKTL
jgi:processive rubber oxygenase RoxA-like protein